MFLELENYDPFRNIRVTAGVQVKQDSLIHIP
jgi:hypothetical protein